MERFKLITHKGKTVIRCDLTDFNIYTKEKLQETMDQVKAEIAKHPPGSVLILTDLTGVRFDIEIVKKFTDFTRDNKPYIKASAVLGVAGLMQSAFYSVKRNALRDIFSFASEVEALDWLAQQ
ncbi:MAG TPA: hypothetical protein VHY08_01850 [Bacillota bacterium]|nr:hypothetical protein [Bacillota bacterium]